MSMQLRLILAVLVILTLGACAQMGKLTNSPQYQKFCSWAPVAVSAIEAASAEARHDPAKHKVGESLAEASSYLRLAASQCPVEGT
jgi:hypothetical protein